MKKGKQFYVFAGDDDFLVDQRASEVFAKYAPQVQDPTSIEVIDGRAQTVEEVEHLVDRFISAVQTRSMFGDRKLVWFRHVSFLADSRLGSSEGNLKQLERMRPLLESVAAEEVLVVFSASPVDRRRSFAKWLVGAGDSVVIDFKKEGGAAFDGEVRRLCKENGVKISGEALQYLRNCLNSSIRMAMQEILKLSDYLGGKGEIGLEDVAGMVPEFGESQFFEPVEKFYQGNLEAVLESLSRYFFTRKEGRPLLAGLIGRNRLMLQLRALGDAGDLDLRGGRLNASDLNAAGKRHLEHFAQPGEKGPLVVFGQNPWYLGMLSQAARRFSLRQLVDFQQLFVSGFIGLVERPQEQAVVIREMVIECLAPSN